MPVSLDGHRQVPAQVHGQMCAAPGAAHVIVWYRIRADFLMASRLGEYASFLESTLAAGYRVVGIEQFWRLASESSGLDDNRYFVLRHDVDTDPRTAEEMWRIERDMGISSSYFFRLSTSDGALMSAISQDGSEVGYHYEELATIAKTRHLRTREAALGALPEARALFRANLARLRAATSLSLRVAASHGDFTNRRLGVPNWLILADRQYRREVGIDLEAYDDDLLGRMPRRSADSAPPRCWVPESPLAAIGRGEDVVYALVHPRHWRSAPLVNARDNLQRLWEGAAFSLPPLKRPRRGPRR